MVDLKSALWERIRDYSLDDPTAKLKFSTRLARENGWSPAYAGRVVEEYKKFVYLALEAGHEVTPSEQVDQAWHLHLVYTRSYWDELCGQVLGRPLHHGPTLGGEAEGKRYTSAYNQTLTSYANTFGEFPPSDIWPTAAIRFSTDTRHRRVNTEHNWIIPKRRAGRLGAGSTLLALSLIGIGAGPLVGGEVVAVFFILAAIGVTLALLAKAAKGNGGRSGCGSACGAGMTGGCGSTNHSNDGGDIGSDGSHSGCIGSGCSSSGCSGGSGCGGGGCGGGGCGGGGD